MDALYDVGPTVVLETQVMKVRHDGVLLGFELGVEETKSIARQELQ